MNSEIIMLLVERKMIEQKQLKMIQLLMIKNKDGFTEHNLTIKALNNKGNAFPKKILLLVVKQMMQQIQPKMIQLLW